MQIGATSDSIWELWNELYDHIKLEAEDGNNDLYYDLWELLLKYGYADTDNHNPVEMFFNSLDKNTLTKLYFDMKKFSK